jgi:hypothetical protein
MSEEVRHFKIEFKDYEDLDVVEYKEYQKLYKETVRLNNIINELEKWLNYEEKAGMSIFIYEIKNKIKKLKGERKWIKNN